ncbi:hypothetical protein ACU686_13810 [Yinghuangia aomiensis]
MTADPPLRDAWRTTMDTTTAPEPAARTASAQTATPAGRDAPGFERDARPRRRRRLRRTTCGRPWTSC